MSLARPRSLTLCSLRAGEIKQRGAEAVLLEQSHIDLQAIVEVEADFVFALGQHLVDSRICEDMVGDGIDVFLRRETVGERQQEVEIADGFLAAAQRTGGRDRSNPFRHISGYAR